MSVLATVLLSALSTLVGIGSKWNLELPNRDADRAVPKSDVIISYPHGAFLIVQCDENIARRLYWAPEKCNYMVYTQAYRFISLVGTLFLMGGVITLANATNKLQLAWAIAYMILNAAYWIVAALPPRWNWDLSSFTVKPVYCVRPLREFSDSGLDPTSKVADKKDVFGEHNTSFTEALWQAIAVTGSSEWARTGTVAPSTEGWDEWLRKAKTAAGKPQKFKDGENLKMKIPVWQPKAILTAILDGNGPAENKA